MTTDFTYIPGPPDSLFHELLQKAVSERVRFIMQNEERFVAAWVAECGWKPSETVLVRKDMDDGSVRMWLEKRTPEDQL